MTSGHACFFLPRGAGLDLVSIYGGVRMNSFCCTRDWSWSCGLGQDSGVVGGCGAPLHGHRATMEFPELRRFEKVPKTTHVIDSRVDPLRR